MFDHAARGSGPNNGAEVPSVEIGANVGELTKQPPLKIEVIDLSRDPPRKRDRYFASTSDLVTVESDEANVRVWIE